MKQAEMFLLFTASAAKVFVNAGEKELSSAAYGFVCLPCLKWPDGEKQP